MLILVVSTTIMFFTTWTHAHHVVSTWLKLQVLTYYFYQHLLIFYIIFLQVFLSTFPPTKNIISHIYTVQHCVIFNMYPPVELHCFHIIREQSKTVFRRLQSCMKRVLYDSWSRAWWDSLKSNNWPKQMHTAH